MELDQEMMRELMNEAKAIQDELIPLVDKLKENPNQSDVLLVISNIIDRIYGTAMTLGLKEIGGYTGVVKNITRQCAAANIPRAYPEVFKIVENCVKNFDYLVGSIQDTKMRQKFLQKSIIDMKRAKKIEEEIFAFSKDANTILTK